jgi:hypothetical protein
MRNATPYSAIFTCIKNFIYKHPVSAKLRSIVNEFKEMEKNSVRFKSMVSKVKSRRGRCNKGKLLPIAAITVIAPMITKVAKLRSAFGTLRLEAWVDKQCDGSSRGRKITWAEDHVGGAAPLALYSRIAN